MVVFLYIIEVDLHLFGLKVAVVFIKVTEYIRMEMGFVTVK